MFFIRRGIVASILVFLCFGVTQAKDGPFSRPHPGNLPFRLCVCPRGGSVLSGCSVCAAGCECPALQGQPPSLWPSEKGEWGCSCSFSPWTPQPRAGPARPGLQLSSPLPLPSPASCRGSRARPVALGWLQRAAMPEASALPLRPLSAGRCLHPYPEVMRSPDDAQRPGPACDPPARPACQGSCSWGSGLGFPEGSYVVTCLLSSQ